MLRIGHDINEWFMKITKVQTPPKDIAHFSGANYPVDDEGINPDDVQDIQYNSNSVLQLDYTVQDNELKLYELKVKKRTGM